MAKADVDPMPDGVPSARALSALAAILALDPTVAGQVRGRTPARRRPRRQTGPTLDVGTPDGDGDGPDSEGPDIEGPDGGAGSG